MKTILLLLGCLLLGESLGQQTTCGPDNHVVITQTNLDSPVRQFIWIDKQTVFLQTNALSIYRSGDGGQTWISQSPLMTNSQAGIGRIYKSHNPQTVYFLGSQPGKLWVTKNGGALYNYYPTPNLLNVAVHPIREDWLLGHAHADECFQTTTDICYWRLYVSFNYGQDWSPVDTYIYQYSWGTAGIDSTPNSTLWIMSWDDKTGNQYRKSVNTLSLKHTTNWMQSVIGHNMNNIIFMLVSNKIMYLVRQETPGSGYELYVSEDGGYNFNLALFPFKELPQRQYMIVDQDDSDGVVFINIQHDSYSWGHLYSSDALGSTYQLSLPYNRRNYTSFTVDFTSAGGLEGIYFANQMSGVTSSTPDGTSIITKATYDSGGLWQTLSPPADSPANVCRPPPALCALHLHGIRKAASGADIRDIWGPLHSNPNAVGLILGVGNVGEGLANDLAGAATYFSRDAGWTWKKLLAGSYVGEWADHGSIMLLFDNANPSTSAYFSSDEGTTLQSCGFSTQAVSIANVITSMDPTSKNFIAHGVPTTGTTGVLYHFNFENLLSRICTDADYETWSPRDNRTGTKACLMGQTQAYLRRLPTADCWNGNEFEPHLPPVPCPCTREDYECDFCYISQDTVCIPDPDCTLPIPTCDPHSHTLLVSTGYRLLPGNQCDIKSGLNLVASPEPCQVPGPGGPGGVSPGGVAGIVIVFLLVGLSGGAGIVYFMCRNNPRFMNMFRNARKGYTLANTEQSTALDEDLLQERDAEVIDDSEIAKALNRPKDEEKSVNNLSSILIDTSPKK